MADTAHILTEKENQGVIHEDWLHLAGTVIERINSEMNTDYEYPFSMSEKTGAGIEYDSMGSAWCLAATAKYEQVTDDRGYMDLLRRSEAHYFNTFINNCKENRGFLRPSGPFSSFSIFSISIV